MKTVLIKSESKISKVNISENNLNQVLIKNIMIG